MTLHGSVDCSKRLRTSMAHLQAGNPGLAVSALKPLLGCHETSSCHRAKRCRVQGLIDDLTALMREWERGEERNKGLTKKAA